jgi:hypothetical protein
LVIGGIPRVEEPNVGRKLPIYAEKKGLVCKFASGKDSKGKNSKNKKMGKPSEVKGMDVKTKESAEKLPSYLVEIIGRLPVDRE